jgi:hypothetical protein
MRVLPFLEEALEAARQAGAGGVEGFHRRSRTRLLSMGPERRPTEGTRTEEGVAIRAWPGAPEDSEAGFAAATAGEDSGTLARRAVEAARRGPGPADVWRESLYEVTRHLPDSARPVSSTSEDEAVQADGPSGSYGSPETLQEPADVPVFDPEILRVSGPELKRRLEPFLAKAGVARRTGLPPTSRALLRLAVVESTLIRPDGETISTRVTLASASLRFPTVFGLTRVELVSRRLKDLDPAGLVPLLAAYPAPSDRMERLEIEPAGDGEIDLVIAAPLAAAMMERLARETVSRGTATVWESPAALADDPLLPWGPGSSSLDGEGRPQVRRILAGPRKEISGAGRPVFSPVRFSFREPPRPAPTNLILTGLPGGASPAGESVQLLEEAVRQGETMIARGVWRRGGEDLRPVVVRLTLPPDRLIGAGTRGGPAPGFVPVGAYCSAPELLVPGFRIVRSG